MRKFAVLILVVIGLVVIGSAVNASGLASDRRLSKQIAIHAIREPVSKILASASKQLGVSLSAEAVLANTPVAASLSKRPASENLQLLADLLLGEWVQNGNGWRLKQSKLGREKEAEILRIRSWTIPDRMKTIRAGLEIPAEIWKKATDQHTDSWGHKSTLPGGLVYPEDYYLAKELTSAEKRAILRILTDLPTPVLKDACKYNGTSILVSTIPESDRLELKRAISGAQLTSKAASDTYHTDVRRSVVDALVSGKYHVRISMKADDLGRWERARINILSWSGEVNIGKEFSQEHMGGEFMGTSKQGTPMCFKYLKVSPRADSRDTIQSEKKLFVQVGKFDWPPVGTLDTVLPATKKKIGIDYLATRFETRDWGRSSYLGPQIKAYVIEGTAGYLGANWERVNGVYLFREKDWPLKRSK